MHTLLWIAGLKPLAYLDPGSGSFLVQLLLGGLLGGIFLLRSYWSKIRAMIDPAYRKQLEEQKQAEEAEQSGPDAPKL